MYWHMNHTIRVQTLVFHVPSVINVHRVIDVIGVGASPAGPVWPDHFFGDFKKFIIQIAYVLCTGPLFRQFKLKFIIIIARAYYSLLQPDHFESPSYAPGCIHACNPGNARIDLNT